MIYECGSAVLNIDLSSEHGICHSEWNEESIDGKRCPSLGFFTSLRSVQNDMTLYG